ncbi:hypothetical protein ACIRVK_39865 [Streptomyces sp. NPDC101152]|uniref:hypothetical protein n=1 Tax=Streptomyces sp. NPDC101152 TaxID=3366116 RepID=UPI0038229AE3
MPLLGRVKPPLRENCGECRRVVPYGFKMSGIGREFGVHGLNAYLETKTVFAA